LQRVRRRRQLHLGCGGTQNLPCLAPGKVDRRRAVGRRRPGSPECGCADSAFGRLSPRKGPSTPGFRGYLLPGTGDTSAHHLRHPRPGASDQPGQPPSSADTATAATGLAQLLFTSPRPWGEPAPVSRIRVTPRGGEPPETGARASVNRCVNECQAAATSGWFPTGIPLTYGALRRRSAGRFEEPAEESPVHATPPPDDDASRSASYD
jgi:hypothetical protein